MDLTEHIDESGQLKPPKKQRYRSKHIEAFGTTGTSVEDMVAILRTPVAKIQKFMDDQKSKFYNSYRRGEALMNQRLKLHALKVALGDEKGNASLLSYLENSQSGRPNTGKKQKDDTDDNTEKLMQNLSPTRKKRIFNMFFNINEKQEKIDEGINE